jgi:hypothetical protein
VKIRLTTFLAQGRQQLAIGGIGDRGQESNPVDRDQCA